MMDASPIGRAQSRVPEERTGVHPLLRARAPVRAELGDRYVPPRSPPYELSPVLGASAGGAANSIDATRALSPGVKVGHDELRAFLDGQERSFVQEVAHIPGAGWRMSKPVDLDGVADVVAPKLGVDRAEYAGFLRTINQVYLEELGRSLALGDTLDTEGVTAWSHDYFERGASIGDIRSRIQHTHEWSVVHGGATPPPSATPTPRTSPAPSDVPTVPGTPSVGDAFDLSQVRWLHTDVSGWDVTSELTDVDIKPGRSITLDHTRKNDWRPVEGVAGNPWVFVNRGGQWYGATYEWLKPGQTEKRINEWNIGGHIKKEPLASWAPQPGETVGFMVSTLARDGRLRNGNERSNVVLVEWPG